MNHCKKIISGIVISSMLILCLAGCKADTGVGNPSENQTAPPQKPVTLQPEITKEKETDENMTEEKKTEEVAKTEESVKTKEPSKTISYQTVYEDNFEDGTLRFEPRGEENIEVTTSNPHSGSYCLKSSNRTATWNGAKIELSEAMTDKKKFEISAWVRYEGTAASIRIYSKVEQNGSEYLNFGSALAKKGEWILLEGTVEIPAGTTSAAVYFETEYKATATADDLADLYIDDIVVREVIVEGQSQELPCLYEKHQEYFTVGIAAENFDLTQQERAKLITGQFNSLTLGNELKPENILDYEACSKDPVRYDLCPAVKFDKADVGLVFAKEHGMPVRGHTLVWHSQTPRWFFTENYSNKEDAPLVTKEVMTARMENYIRQVLTYCQETYPGVIYCWDVVNEAMNPGDCVQGGYRSSDSLWYQIMGPEYIELAFTYARKYAAKEVKLFYNDFNCYEKVKLFDIYEMCKSLYEKGILDGIGLQSHISMTTPSMTELQYAITKLGSIGVQIHITELDINLDSNSTEDLRKLGTKYKKLMTMYRYEKENQLADITNVTIWGLTDDRSWLITDTQKYPLLFDSYLQAKDAFWGCYLDDSIRSY